MRRASSRASTEPVVTRRRRARNDRSSPTTLLPEGRSAYSSLAVLPDGSVGVLYERGEKNHWEKIGFVRFGLDLLAAPGN